MENEEARTVGAEHVVYETIKELGIDKKLIELGFDRYEVAGAIGVIASQGQTARSDRT